MPHTKEFKLIQMLEANESNKKDIAKLNSSYEHVLRLIATINEQLEEIHTRLDVVDCEPDKPAPSSFNARGIFLKKSKDYVENILRSHFENDKTGAGADLERVSPEIYHYIR